MHSVALRSEQRKVTLLLRRPAADKEPGSVLQMNTFVGAALARRGSGHSSSLGL